MAERPYSRFNINDLEKLWETSKGDIGRLQALQKELQHRKTPRSAALRLKVEQHLRANSAEGVAVSSSQVSSGSLKIESAVKLSPKPTSSKTSIVPSRNHVHAAISSQADTGPTIKPPSRPASVIPVSPNTSAEPRINLYPDQVLAAWLTLEVLTPQPMPNERELEVVKNQLVRLEESPEPWLDPRFGRQGRERAVYWMVYLGELNLAKALESILEVFPDDVSDERSEVRGTTTLAVVVLDAKGRPVPDKTFLSSFAWGYGRVRAGELKELAKFAEAERAIKSQLEKRLICQDENGEIRPLEASDINRVIEWLTQALNLHPDDVLRPGVAIRVPLWGRYNEAPEPELLNSFFIEDLVRIRKSLCDGDVGKALSAYIGTASMRARQDVVLNKALLAETLAPDRAPLARWPGPNRCPLMLMQQAAINHAVAELTGGGLIAINGPPGTGKTTLLRDIVAKVVLDRAISMAQFDKPESAFTHITAMKTGTAFSHLYQLHESLCGHEIVVASSNNKAVENISREIPSSAAVADDFDPPLRYFQSISDMLAAGKDVLVDRATWGLAAAVLGNSANRAAFINSFWWDKRRGMALYLKAVGGGVVAEDDDKELDNDDERRVPDVVSIEQPPRSEIEARQRWHKARKEFLAKLEAVKTLQAHTKEVYLAVCRRPEAIKQVEDARRLVAEAKQALEASLAKEGSARQLHTTAMDRECKAIEDRAAIDRLRPGFFARLFWTRTFREWRLQMAMAVEAVARARMQIKAAEEAVRKSEQEVLAAKQELRRVEVQKMNADRILVEILASIDSGRSLVGSNFVDEAFWEQEDATIQTASPWVFDGLQKARDALFVAAFALHRAFIDASAKYLRHNIRGALDLLKGRALSDKQEPARRSLWASLFLVVPVVSTTFASTSRLFGSLGREQLGWLLIDEAGQAVPQAAVGALWRAKRAIVIGDPLQIKPVVTIPPKLIKAIFSEFGIQVDDWAGPEMSAQALADRVSWLGTSIQTSDGDIWVGSPLRVHRRCEEPMFSISNHVAYDNLMVYATPPGESPIGRVLGESAWINVTGDALGKWSDSEGEMALQLLRSLFDAGLKDPDIFFITPFRMVAYKLREMIRRDQRICDCLPGDRWEWINNRVGTIHTFQGKEADAVVLVLGAPLDASAGARRWAGHPPNLLNVAVTRAKRRLYVIGNREAWKSAGAFTHLAQLLPATG